MDRSWPSADADRDWPEDDATAYALGVRDGEIIAGPHVRAAARRHLADLVDGPDRALVWRPDQVERVLRYFSGVLRLNGGEWEGEPFEPLPWQRFILGSLFGWHRKQKGRSELRRRFRVAFVETAKGSGKSPLAAGIGLYMLTADGEPRAECYSAAAKKDQAMILFRDAVAMVEQSPRLEDHLHKSGANPVWNLSHLKSGSFFRAISSDDSQSGPRPHYAALDEIHEHRTDQVVEMMRAGTKSRRQPLIFMITNSGVDRTSVCYDRHEYGTKLAAGELQDDTFFAYICAVDEEEDPITDEADPELGYPVSWAKANPSLGVVLPVSYLEEQVREARGMPAKESIVRRLNFCQWVDAESPWISGDLWRACEWEELPYEVVERPCYAGLDLSGTRDLTALAKVWPDDDGGFDAEVEFWTPGDTMVHRARTDRVPYDAWERDGYLNAPQGRSVNFAVLAKRVQELWEAGGITALAFDPYRFDEFCRELDRLGVPWWMWEGPDTVPSDGLLLVRHGQGYGGGQSEKSLWMPGSIKATEEAILGERLRIRKNPVLTWNAASAVLAMDAQENQKWEKRKSTGRIDGVVALSMAIGATTLPVEESADPWVWVL